MNNRPHIQSNLCKRPRVNKDHLSTTVGRSSAQMAILQVILPLIMTTSVFTLLLVILPLITTTSVFVVLRFDFDIGYDRLDP
jgi:hypothetical protein